MKHFSTKIDDDVDLALTLYSIHIGCSKGEAGARAMADGIPGWVMAVPPSEAKAMARDLRDSAEPGDEAAHG